MACAICGVTHGLEEHHIIPKSLGGEHGPTVILCGSCHSSAHFSAKGWLAGKSTNTFPPNLQEKALPYIQAIVAAAERFRALGGQSREIPGKLLTVKIRDPAVLAALHIVKRDAGFTNLETFLNALFERMTEHLRNKRG